MTPATATVAFTDVAVETFADERRFDSHRGDPDHGHARTKHDPLNPVVAGTVGAFSQIDLNRRAAGKRRPLPGEHFHSNRAKAEIDHHGPVIP